MIGHYVAAWYYLFLVQTHVMYIHEMWAPTSAHGTAQDASTPKPSWLFDALTREASLMVTLYTTLMLAVTRLGHPNYRPVDFSFFEQWSETEVEDVNFFIVGPHWYFRAHMGLLTVCSEHYEGLA